MMGGAGFASLVVGALLWAALLWAQARGLHTVAALLLRQQLTAAEAQTIRDAGLQAAIAGTHRLLLDLRRVRSPATADTVLVIDDDPAHLELVRRWLGGAGYVVHVAPDAELALRFLATHPFPEVVVVDIRLPYMDGLEFVRQLRAAGGAMPILAYSGDSEARRDAILAGCHDFVPKSGESAPLLACVAQWLAIAQQGRT